MSNAFLTFINPNGYTDFNKLIILDIPQWTTVLEGAILSLNIQFMSLCAALTLLVLIPAAWFSFEFIKMRGDKNTNKDSDEYTGAKYYALVRSKPFFGLSGFMFVMSIASVIIYTKWNDTCQFFFWVVCPVYALPSHPDITFQAMNIFDYACTVTYYGSIATVLSYVHNLARGPYVTQMVAVLLYSLWEVSNKTLYYSNEFYWGQLVAGSVVGMLIAGGSVMFSRLDEKRTWRQAAMAGNVLAALILFPGHWAIAGTVGGSFFFELPNWNRGLYMDMYLGIGAVALSAAATFVGFYWEHEDLLKQEIASKLAFLKTKSDEGYLTFNAKQKTMFLQNTKGTPVSGKSNKNK